MSFSKILRFVLIVFALGNTTWALDNNMNKEFNLDNFKYQYKADLDCEITHLQGSVIGFHHDSEKGSVEVFADGNLYSKIEGLSEERRTFNSCFSDGFMGYSESLLYYNRMIDRTIIQYPGFFCTGKTEKSRDETSYIFVKDKLTVRDVNVDYEKNESSDRSCRFTRINF